MASLQTLVTKSFRDRGLLLRPAATTRIKAFLEEQNEGRPDYHIQRLVLHIKGKGLRSNAVEQVDIEEALLELNQDLSESKHPVFTYVDALTMPKFEYEPVRKSMNRAADSGVVKLHGNGDDKANMLRERWQLLHQRMSRNALFAPPPVNSTDQEFFVITAIEALIGRPGPKLIFGMLTQILEGQWFIEDTNSVIEIVLTDAEIITGLFVENCMVLAQGELVGEKFYVTTLGLPPPEPREETLATFPQLEDFGLDPNSESKKERDERKTKLMEEHVDDMIVILSDVHLDNPQVMTQLHTLFTGYHPSRPPLFVFCGSFTSREMGYAEDDAKTLQGYFGALCDLILQFPGLAEESRFMFVPGPHDPVKGGEVLPSPPIPDYFTHKLKEKLGDRVIMATNPARFIYCNQEVVIFRHDLLHHMRRNCVVPPSTVETVEVSEHLARTVIDQAHLCPLPQYKLPIYWNHDHALRLYPIPHALILADSVDQYHWNYENAACFNPGSFACDFSFVVYWPGKEEKVEFSRIR